MVFLAKVLKFDVALGRGVGRLFFCLIGDFWFLNVGWRLVLRYRSFRGL
jgi:hypothetical protein